MNKPVTRKTKIQVGLTLGSVALAFVIGLYALGVFTPRHAQSNTPTKDVLLMGCNDLDLQFNYYLQQSLTAAKTDPSLSIAYNRQANTLLSIYNDQGCFASQNQTSG